MASCLTSPDDFYVVLFTGDSYADYDSLIDS